MKYYLVTLEWSTGFTSYSAIMGNRLEGEKQNIAKLSYVKNATFDEIEQHEYQKYWTGEFKPQKSSSGSERTSKEVPKSSKGPQFSSLDTFFTNTEKPTGKPKRKSK